MRLRLNTFLVGTLAALVFAGPVIPADSADSVARIERYLNRAVENGYAGSVLIAVRGKIILQKGYGLADSEKNIPFTADTIFDIGSITKQFTAACILKLEMQGKLKVQDPITKFFDAVPEDKKGITLHHLLTHSAGLTDSLGADEEWIGREQYVTAALNSKLIHAPGTYAYSNVGYSLLAAVVEKVSGSEYEQYLAAQLLKPAGMKKTGYVLPAWDKTKMAIGYQNGKRWGTTFDQSNYAKGVTWHLKGNGGIHSTVGDLYLWSRALRINSLLSEAARQKYFAPHVSSGDRESYGYGWSVFKNQRGETVITHNGGNGSFMDTLAMIPETDFVVIVSTNRYPKNTDTIARRLDKILFEGLEELSETFLKKYAGEYVLPSGVSFPLSFGENDEVMVVLNDPESWRLLGGSSSDNAARIKQIDEKSRELMQGLLTGDAARIASASGLAKQAVEADFPKLRQRIEDENGKCKDFDQIGSVARRKGQYHLTAVRLKCEKTDTVKTIVWNGDTLSGFRDLPNGNAKSFDHVKGQEFFAESNNLAIVLDDLDNRPVLRIKSSANEIIARKK